MAEFYLIQCKDTKGEVFTWEASERDATHAATIQFIFEGNVSFDIHRVIEVDLEAGTARDVSDDIASHIHGLSHSKQEEVTAEVAAFCERYGYDTHKDPEPGELWDDLEHYFYSGRADHERQAYAGYF